MSRAPLSVMAARARARTRVGRGLRDWAAGEGVDDEFVVPLHPPTERAVLADLPAMLAWVESWQSAASEFGGIRFAARRWPSVGTQDVPDRVVLRGADEICAFAGPAAVRDWKRVRERADLLRTQFGSLQSPPSEPLTAAIRSHAAALLELPDVDFARFVAVISWLIEHPASGRRPRELPIRGIDTKWIGTHRRIVEAFHLATTGSPSLGLLAPPTLARVRVLDPALRPGGLTDITAPLDELGALHVDPRVVLVVENLETLLALPSLEGVIALHGSGYGAHERVAALPWARRIVYWGDLDSHGFAILSQLRTVAPSTVSVLMDEPTLLANRDLWVPEPKPAVGLAPNLTDAERAALARIRLEGSVRLEQERIPWLGAIEAVRDATRLP